MQRAVTGIGLVLVAVLALLLYREHSRREEAEARLGLDSARVLSAIFTQQQDLRVATLTGQVVAKSAFDGTLFHPEQITRAPYSVSYFVDLGHVGGDDYRWDAASKTMDVRIDDVVVERPSIDMTRAVVLQNGAWISRTAGVTLQRRAAEQLAARSAAISRSDQNMAKARRAAVETVSQMVRRPLAAAGFRDVGIRVRFPWEGNGSAERMDRSRSLPEVFGNRR